MMFVVQTLVRGNIFFMINLDTRLLDQVKDANQLFLLMHISKRINVSTNQCFPSNATLQKDTGWSRTKVYEVRQQLIDLNIIKITERRLESDRSQSSIITLNTEHISFFVTAKKLTKEFKEEDTPPSATADAPVRHSEPTPSATANTELINQSNKLTIEQYPLTPFKKGEEIEIDNNYLSIKDWCDSYLNICNSKGLRRAYEDIDQKKLKRHYNKWLSLGRDPKETLMCLNNMLNDAWERKTGFRNVTIAKLFSIENVAKWNRPISQKSNY